MVCWLLGLRRTHSRTYAADALRAAAIVSGAFSATSHGGGCAIDPLAHWSRKAKISSAVAPHGCGGSEMGGTAGVGLELGAGGCEPAVVGRDSDGGGTSSNRRTASPRACPPACGACAARGASGAGGKVGLSTCEPTSRVNLPPYAVIGKRTCSGIHADRVPALLECPHAHLGALLDAHSGVCAVDVTALRGLVLLVVGVRPEEEIVQGLHPRGEHRVFVLRHDAHGDGAASRLVHMGLPALGPVLDVAHDS